MNYANFKTLNIKRSSHVFSSHQYWSVFRCIIMRIHIPTEMWPTQISHSCTSHKHVWILTSYNERSENQLILTSYNERSDMKISSLTCQRLSMKSDTSRTLFLRTDFGAEGNFCCKDSTTLLIPCEHDWMEDTWKTVGISLRYRVSVLPKLLN